MRFYQLEIKPSEGDGEGEDHDEWFTSLAAAKARRAEVAASVRPEESPVWASVQSTGFTGEDFAIYAVDLVDCAPRELVLAVLNRRGFVARRELVVPPIRFENGKRRRG